MKELHVAATRAQLAHPDGLNVTVMGLGLNGGGLESARYFASRGALVTATDLRDETTLAPSIKRLEGLPIRFVLGKHDLDDFKNADIVIKNPAVKQDSQYLSAARDRIETDISIFLALSKSPLIAVTGTKGKSTTASAIHHALVSAGHEAFLGGNITISPLVFLDRTSPEKPVVLELSSWQLADIHGRNLPGPKIAAITSIMPDHMNYYNSMEEYVADKKVIYEHQAGEDFTICNYDQSWGKVFASETRARVIWYSTCKTDIDGGWLEPESGPERRGYFRMPSLNLGTVHEAELVIPGELLVSGNHNRQNLLAAACALRAFGLSAAEIASGLKSFRGVEHRMERFETRNGIEWFNDSAATIPQAAIAAISSFSSPPILITGGTDKNIDFEPVYSGFSKAKRIVLLAGTGTDKLRPLLDSAGIEYSGPYKDIVSAIEQAHGHAKPGDSIILSPGCTSFGMFLNEFDRGTKFKAAVREFLERNGDSESWYKESGTSLQ